ncbi:efflux RND transporter periplasmic adaptor subunit [Marinicella sp. W31]|uniref:efflux RND transporter periplasmic adaptor subunit n=1 Tax=Marinicella sp. W31 TaxID=3023713 RepID=UPI003757794A
MKKLLKIVSPILVLVLSVFVVQALVAAKPKPEKKEKETRLVSLYVDEVQSDSVTLSVGTQGVVKPKTSIDLISRVNGHIVSISDSFAEGAEFDSGTLLIKIDDTDYQLAKIRAEAQVATAQVAVERELANAKIKQEQWNYKTQTGEPTPFALNKPQVAEAKALLRAAEADLAEAKLNIDRTEIKVPFKGRVTSRSIGEGQYITAGTVLGQVFSTDIAEVRLPLTDAQLAELDLPMGFMGTKENSPEVYFTAKVGLNNHVWKGHIVRTNASVDQQTRLIYAVAQIADPYGVGADNGVPFAVGMFVTADINGVNSQDAMVLPRMALRNADKVYVVNDESRLEIRTVEVLSTTTENVYVSSGVEPGEKVVTSTLTAAVDGMEVRALDREETDSLVSQL